MQDLVAKVLIPTVIEKRKEYMGGARSINLLHESHGAVESAPARFRPMPRIVLTLDGEDTHLQAIFSELIDTGLAREHAIEIVKFPASSSKFLQPCDVSPMYRSMKKVVGRMEGWVCPSLTADITDILAAVPSASRKTFTTFLGHLPAVISKACPTDTIRKGWACTGLWPFDQDVVLGPALSRMVHADRQATLPNKARHARAH